MSIPTADPSPSAANPPPPKYVPSSSSSSAAATAAAMEQLIFQLSDPDLREKTLQDLAKRRDILQDLAPLLWNARGAIFALLEEIMPIYRALSPPTLTSAASNRVCNALALLQCVASHPETRIHFLNAHIPLYLYPFLNTTSKAKPFEYLRLTSLGVIGALVKIDDNEVVNFLLSTEIVPLCLRSMEMGSELSKTVATFIVQKILLDEVGLQYVCTTPGRVVAIARVFASMVHSLDEQPSPRLLKHIVRCYLRLSEDERACEVLLTYLPNSLKVGSLNNLLNDDLLAQQWLQQLLNNVSALGRRFSSHKMATIFDQLVPI